MTKIFTISYFNMDPHLAVSGPIFVCIGNVNTIPVTVYGLKLNDLLQNNQ